MPTLPLLERITFFALIASMVDSMICNTLAMNITFPFDVSHGGAFWSITGIRLLSVASLWMIMRRLSGPGIVSTLEDIKETTDEILDEVSEDDAV